MPPTATADEAGLLRDARAGDRAALGELLRRHERRLFNVALGIVRHHGDAEDVTQDALVKVVQKLDDFRGDAQLTTWMTRITVNQAISLLRKRKTRHAVSLDADRAGANGEAFSVGRTLEQARELPPDHRVQEQEEHARLRDAIARLDESFRVPLVLRDLDGMDYQEIADTLDLPLGTVKSRLFRARLMLREELSRDESRGNEANSPA